jgi:hypothetical protein
VIRYSKRFSTKVGLTRSSKRFLDKKNLKNINNFWMS